MSSAPPAADHEVEEPSVEVAASAAPAAAPTPVQPAAPAEPLAKPESASPTPAKKKPEEPASGVQVGGNPGSVKVTVDQAGRVGIWTPQPASMLHLHSDDEARAAQVTVTGATAGFTFGVRVANADLAAMSDTFELYANEDGAVIGKAGAKLATFAPDGTAKVLGKVHAESFESTSSRAFKSHIEPFPAERAHKVRAASPAPLRGALTAICPLTDPRVSCVARRRLTTPVLSRAALPGWQVLDGLDAVRYEFTRTGEKHVGFIAEDVPDELSNENHTSIKVLDLVSVLTCIVKEQRATIEQLTQRVERLESLEKRD